MKTLYVSDLDGTLLNKHDQISDYTKNTVNRLIQEGISFTFATARSLSSASIVAKGLSLSLPVIVYNGTFIKELNTGKTLLSNSFDPKQSNYIADLLEQNHISPLVYSFQDGVEKVSWIKENINDGKKRYFSMRQNDKRMTPLSSSADLYHGDIFYFTCIGEKEELLLAYELLKENPDYRCTLQQELYRKEYWFEIMHKNASKSNAITQLCKLFDYNRIISFGDAINDLSMFAISDECYAVENAVSELKQAATGIIESNETDGVAKWLSAHCK